MCYQPWKFNFLERFFVKNKNTIEIKVTNNIKQSIKDLDEKKEECEYKDAIHKTERKKNEEQEKLGLGIYGKVDKLFKENFKKEPEIQLFND